MCSHSRWAVKKAPVDRALGRLGLYGRLHSSYCIASHVRTYIYFKCLAVPCALHLADKRHSCCLHTHNTQAFSPPPTMQMQHSARVSTIPQTPASASSGTSSNIAYICCSYNKADTQTPLRIGQIRVQVPALLARSSALVAAGREQGILFLMQESQCSLRHCSPTESTISARRPAAPHQRSQLRHQSRPTRARPRPCRPGRRVLFCMGSSWACKYGRFFPFLRGDTRGVTGV
jgi:hypothetical protein